MDYIEGFLAGIRSTSFWEWLAVLTSMLYVFFAAKKMVISWLFALVTSAIYIYICFHIQLYIETLLQVFYLIMAIVGWYSWRKQSSIVQNERFGIQTWKWRHHLLNIVISAVLSLLLGALFAATTNQANPYIDAFTTVYSLAATYMVTQKILENWLYWIVIDATSIYLYAERGLILSSVLFLFFTLLAVYGFFAWRSDYKKQLA